ncbi:hypothetical protein [Azospirillum cavernae]|uniref:hypothetical protein n=1 Tax=Azospirillum cavernae TaxID=2320860 RepID=UPI001314B1F0|nr:hypothetical protein [Azospirillum cavernae]
MRHPFMGAAAQFAHLAGLGRRATKAESDERKDDETKGKRAEDEDEDPDAVDPDDEKEKAEDEGKDPDDADPDDEKEKAEDDESESKKAKKSGKTYSAGRSDERKRCALIFGSPHAAGQAHVAARLAFSTNLTATEAVGLLAETSASVGQGKRGLGERMAHVESPAVGPDGGGPEKGSVAETVARMTNAYNRATSGAAKK